MGLPQAYAADGDPSDSERVELLRKGSHIIFKYALDGDKNAHVALKITMSGENCNNRELNLSGDISRVNKGLSTVWNFDQDFPGGCKAELSVDITSPPLGMAFVKGGCFIMGDTYGDGDTDEVPAHEVCLPDFYMDAYEVTNKQYKELTGESPSYFKVCNDCPVDQVTWYQAVEYCQILGKRLPTEAEWEYAARAGGRQFKWPGTGNLEELVDYVRYMVNTNERPQKVGTRKPNLLGIYDMGGNVWEWISDWYSFDYYVESPKDNPQGPAKGEYRIVRGGAWNYEKMMVRSSHRNRLKPENTDSGRGFRCVLSP